MKKVLLLCLSIISVLGLHAQCVPGAKTTTGKGYIIPDSATNMVHACAGKPYEETFYIKAFKDTAITIFTGKTDSFVINLDPVIVGIPSYLNIASVPATRPATALHNYPHLVIKGDSLACIKVSGNVPSGTTAGTTSLNIGFLAYLGVYLGGLKATDTVLGGSYNDYLFVVDPAGTGACALGINSLNKTITNVAVVPNPVMGNATIDIQATFSQKAILNITNMLGQVVYTTNTQLLAGSNTVPLPIGNIAAGVYNFSLINENGKVNHGKFVKQ